jgi:voltage-gated potassium channel
MSLLAAVGKDQAEVLQPDAVAGTRTLRRRVYEVLERAEPGDRLSAIVDAFLISLIILSTTAIILESISAVYAIYETEFFWFEAFTVGVFTLEYGLRCWSCVEGASPDSGPWQQRRSYLRSGSALIDLVAILPFYLMLTGAGGLDMRFLRMFRLLRVLKLTRYSAAIDILIQAFRENARSLAAAFFILLMVMLVAATGMYHFEREAQPDAFSSIPASMWWAFATLTTVGYGDITPVTAGGRIFGALITVLGLGMVALPTGILASAYTEQLRRRSERYRRSADLALEDGVLSDREVEELEELRKSLGLDKEVAEEILGWKKSHFSTGRSCCPYCGRSP